MLNTEDFTYKLQTILDYYSLTASAFADKIGVQRSSLSHLLSGRNKPSLEFVLKISDVFPEVDLYWLLLDKGEFPKEGDSDNTITEILNKPSTSTIETNLFDQTEIQEESFSKENKTEAEISKSIEYINSKVNQIDVAVEKIVVFYNDGTFKQYIQKK